MAEIIDVRLPLDAINKQLDQLDQRFGKSQKEAGAIGNEGVKSFKEMATAIRGAETELERTTATIKEQRSITSQFKRELLELERQYKRLQSAQQTGRNLAQQKQLKAQIDQVKNAIKDQTLAQQELNAKQRDQKSAIKDLRDQAKEANKTGAVIKKLGALIGGAFALNRIRSFGQEAIKLADQARGVTTAFRQLNNVSLDNLREATQGTVNDLQLMQAAVTADKFGIPVERLGELLQFAQVRARETGLSVDYLTDSIVTGLGRKSIKILDNLGISSEELKASIGGVGIESVSVAQLTNALADNIGLLKKKAFDAWSSLCS